VRLVAFALLVASVSSLRINTNAPGASTGADEPGICGTMDVYQARLGNMSGALAPHASCPTQGSCDVATTRSKAPAGIMKLNLIFHVFQSANGSYPNGVNQAVINAAVAQLQQDYNNYNLIWNLVSTNFHKDSAYYCIAPYSSNKWQAQVDQMKLKYAVSPSKNINIFVSCQTPGTSGTLLGFGTFPWDKNALTSLGGVWCNSLAIGKGQRTMTHELGHNLGLWHTFHGVSELSGCSNACYENYHSPIDSAANAIGDFCADTPGTPVNYNCKAPPGADCYKVSWGQTDFTNYMSYSDDSCMNHFSDQQVGRIHCWGCSALSSVMPVSCAQS